MFQYSRIPSFDSIVAPAVIGGLVALVISGLFVFLITYNKPYEKYFNFLYVTIAVFSLCIGPVLGGMLGYTSEKESRTFDNFVATKEYAEKNDTDASCYLISIDMDKLNKITEEKAGLKNISFDDDYKNNILNKLDDNDPISFTGYDKEDAVVSGYVHFAKENMIITLKSNADDQIITIPTKK